MGKLIGSILTCFIAGCLIAVVIFGFLLQFGVGTESMNPLGFLSAKIDSDDTEDLLMTILESQLFMALCFFFVICTSHGNDTIGQRFATFTFYPMKENETLLSSFLANTALRVFVVTGVRQYTVMIFASWTRGSISYQQSVVARNT